jgi:predicted amidohydrolase YtcJ
LGFRLNALPIILPDGSKTPFAMPEKFSSPFFNVNTVKFFADGGLSGKTSALKRFYKNSNEQGVLRLEAKQYSELSKDAMEKGLGVATHAIGDAAIEMVINVYKELHQLYPGVIKRIEHLGLPEKQHLQAMKENNIACSMQTIFLNELGNNFIKYLDEKYLDHCYPVKSVLDQGILMALSSDAPVVKNFNPFKGTTAAVNRKNKEGELIGAQESITISQALKAYTESAARISGENRFGTLETGKLADFIILDKNPLSVDIDELNNIHVLKTFVDGKEVWTSAIL